MGIAACGGSEVFHDDFDGSGFGVGVTGVCPAEDGDWLAK